MDNFDTNEQIELKGLSLWKLQDAARLAEEEISAEADLSKIVGAIAGKIDAIKEIIDILDLEAERWAGYAQTMAARKKAAETASNRLKAYVAASLIHHETTFELGNVWKAQLTTSERVIADSDPSIDDVLELGDLGIIKTEYAWDKKAIKKLIEEGNEKVKNVARIEKNHGIRFSANSKQL